MIINVVLSSFLIHIEWTTEKCTKLMVRDEKLSEANYKLLAELLLTRTIIFNKRRQAEVQELTVKNLYESLVTDEHQEIVKSLTMPEQILSRRSIFRFYVYP